MPHQRVIHMWMSHVKHINKTYHIHESCHVWMSHVTHINASCHINESFTCEWVMSNTSMRRVTSVSHITYEWVMSRHNNMNGSWHMWMSHITYEWVMSHMNESCHINASCSHVNESSHTCQSSMSHPRVMPHMNESYCTYPSAMSRAFTIGTLRMVPSSSSSLSFETPSYSHYSWELLLYHECQFQISGSFFTMKAGRPAPPLILPHPPPFVGILLSVILDLPFREMAASNKKTDIEYVAWTRKQIQRQSED